MIRKSVKRFSEKIMPKQGAMQVLPAPMTVDEQPFHPRYAAHAAAAARFTAME
jgi:hypothetical protein